MHALAYTSTALTPVMAFGVYILLAKYNDYPLMDNGRVFTSLALLQLLLEPVAFFITALSGLMSALGCFERIRIYLNSEARDNIKTIEPLLLEEPVLLRHKRAPSGDDDGLWLEFEKEKQKEACIVARMASCGWSKEKAPLLRNMDFQIRRGNLTMIIGPVSCGKSTLLKALLHETPLATGFRRPNSGHVAYCEQTPWLTNGTLKGNILGDSHFDPAWYRTVIRACSLEKDLSRLALGENTVIGSKGLALSGGQQMRVVSLYIVSSAFSS